MLSTQEPHFTKAAQTKIHKPRTYLDITINSSNLRTLTVSPIKTRQELLGPYKFSAKPPLVPSPARPATADKRIPRSARSRAEAPGDAEGVAGNAILSLRARRADDRGFSVARKGGRKLGFRGDRAG
ncbi:hypothetical protein KM043_012707 [Ampulex compressa]|nr:hypothetical protein KM043_012707 [Ampulex compressa]